jgi:ureidoglycolate lyase
MTTRTPRPLTREAFAPFGHVLMAIGDESQRREFAAPLKNYRVQATLNMAYLLSRPEERPWSLTALERHPYSSQSFVPVQGTRYLVAVCSSSEAGEPVLDRLELFIADGDQAVTYSPDVWHAPHRVLDGPGKFIMLRWDVGNADDTELFPLDPPIALSLDA